MFASSNKLTSLSSLWEVVVSRGSSRVVNIMDEYFSSIMPNYFTQFQEGFANSNLGLSLDLRAKDWPQLLAESTSSRFDQGQFYALCLSLVRGLTSRKSAPMTMTCGSCVAAASMLGKYSAFCC